MPRRRGGSFSHIRQFQIHRYLGMTSLQLGEDFAGTVGAEPASTQKFDVERHSQHARCVERSFPLSRNL
jgi:hypothetical protein